MVAITGLQCWQWGEGGDSNGVTVVVMGCDGGKGVTVVVRGCDGGNEVMVMVMGT